MPAPDDNVGVHCATKIVAGHGAEDHVLSADITRKHNNNGLGIKLEFTGGLRDFYGLVEECVFAEE